MNDAIKIITTNRKANFQYSILETYEAGIVLEGTEVKSLRQGKCSIQEAYIISDDPSSLYIKNMTIPEYSHGNINNHNPTRKRKLLLHSKEIKSILRAINEKGVTAIPLKIYFKGSLVKVVIGLGRGKKIYDKRDSIKKRDDERHTDRELKNKY